MKIDHERRLKALESKRPTCPRCEYIEVKLNGFTDSQLRSLLIKTDRQESRDNLSHEISDEDEAKLADFFENLPEPNPDCPECRADLEGSS